MAGSERLNQDVSAVHELQVALGSCGKCLRGPSDATRTQGRGSQWPHWALTFSNPQFPIHSPNMVFKWSFIAHRKVVVSFFYTHTAQER